MEAKVVFLKNSYDPDSGRSFYASEEHSLDVDMAQRQVDQDAAVFVDEELIAEQPDPEAMREKAEAADISIAEDS